LRWHDGGSGRFDAFKHATEAMSLRSGVGLPGRVLESGLPVLSPDLASDDNFPCRAAALAVGLASGYAFPVRPSIGGMAVIELFSIRRATREPRLAALIPQLTAQLAPIFSRHWLDAERFRRSQELDNRVRQRTEVDRAFRSGVNRICAGWAVDGFGGLDGALGVGGGGFRV
jgi:hypothetical protein